MPLKSTVNKKVIGVVLLLAAALAVGYLFKKQKLNGLSPQTPDAQTYAVGGGTSKIKLIRLSQMKEIVKEESERLGSVDPDPAKTAQHLREIANAADPESLEYFSERSLSPSVPQDERFLASMLLALSEAPMAIPLLQRIAMAPFQATESAHDNHGSIEWMVRAQAIEGFEKFAQQPGVREQAMAAIHAVVAAVDNSFLKTRALQVLETFQRPAGEVAPLEVRDEKALEELLE